MTVICPSTSPSSQFLKECGSLLMRVQGSAHDGRLIRIRSPKCTIGSAPGCTLRLRAHGVAPLNCWILRGPSGTVIRRLHGAATLNGGRFDESPLCNGDRLRIGGVELEVVDCRECAQDLAQQPFPKLAAPTTSTAELESRLEEVTEQVGRLEGEARQGWQSSIVAAERANQLRDALASADQQLADAAQELAAAQETIAQQTAELDSLRRRLSHGRADEQGRIDGLKRQLAARDADLEVVKREANATSGAMTIAFEKLDSQAEAEKQALVTRCSDLESQNATWQQELARGEQVWLQARQERTTAMLEQRETATRIAALEQQLDEQLHEVQTLRQKAAEYATLKSRAEELAGQVAQQNRALAEAKQQTDAARALALLQDEQAAQLQKLAQKREEIEAREREITRQQLELSRVSREAEDQRRQQAAEQHKLQAALEQLEQDRKGISAAQEQLQAERRQLGADKEMVAEARRQLEVEHQRPAAMQREFGSQPPKPAAVEQPLTAAQAEIHAQRERLATEQEEFRARCGQLEVEIQQLAGERAALKSERREFATQQEQVEADRQRTVEKAQQLAEERAQLEAERQRFAVEREEFTAQKIAPAEQLREYLDQHNAELEAQQRAFDEKVAEFELRCQQFEQEVDEWKAGRQAEAAVQPECNDRSEVVNAVNVTAPWQPPEPIVTDDESSEAEPSPLGVTAPLAAPAEDVTGSGNVDSVLSRLVRAGVWRNPNEQEAAEPPAAAVTPPAAVHATAPAAVQEAPAYSPPPAAPEDPTPASSVVAPEEDSIESYMDRLLKRVRGESTTNAGGWKQSPSAESTPSPTPAPAPVAPEPVSLEPVVAQPAPPNEEYVPRTKAPELNTDLTAMRAVANCAAQAALDRHSQKHKGKQAVGRLFGAGLTAVASLLLGYWAWKGHSLQAAIGAALGCALGLFWLLGAARRILSVIRLNRPAAAPTQEKSN